MRRVLARRTAPDPQRRPESFRSRPVALPGAPWRVAETADELIDAGTIPPLVVCGVDHAGPGRLREFTPTPGPRREGGDADDNVYLVRHQILPFLRASLPLRTDRASVGIGGSSLGGLVALWMAIAYPERSASSSRCRRRSGGTIATCCGSSRASRRRSSRRASGSTSAGARAPAWSLTPPAAPGARASRRDRAAGTSRICGRSLGARLGAAVARGAAVLPVRGGGGVGISD